MGLVVEYLELEKEFAKYIGVKGSISVSTGTAALHVALEALRLPEKSEIIIPQYTMIATAWAAYYARLVPVFIDCCDDLLIDISKIKQKISPKTRVIMVTHIYGRVVNMDEVMSLAKEYGLRVVEDAAEAHGCTWNNKMVGSYDIGCFSFYRNKIICGEEGGAVTSDDLDFLEIVKDMKSMSFGKSHNYMHMQIGFNYRMANSQASLIRDSLNNVQRNIAIRRKYALLYDSIIDKKYHMPRRDVPWVYDIKVENNTIVNILRNKDIPARYGFKPVSTSAPFFEDATHTKAYEKSKNIMYLPIGPELNEDTITHIASSVRELL
tara:strand:- start:146 stop:1111 length:966 start_codon:yes stop_codon:yes gene_type:complete